LPLPYPPERRFDEPPSNTATAPQGRKYEQAYRTAFGRMVILPANLGPASSRITRAAVCLLGSWLTGCLPKKRNNCSIIVEPACSYARRHVPRGRIELCLLLWQGNLSLAFYSRSTWSIYPCKPRQIDTGGAGRTLPTSTSVHCAILQRTPPPTRGDHPKLQASLDRRNGSGFCPPPWPRTAQGRPSS